MGDGASAFLIKLLLILSSDKFFSLTFDRFWSGCTWDVCLSFLNAALSASAVVLASLSFFY